MASSAMARPLIRNADARRFLLAAQGLCHPPGRKLAGGGLLELIDQLGYVQLDSINTVERAHHLILFARCQTYRRDHLAGPLEREASLFENWTHDAAVIPSRFYRYWMPRFDRERDGLRRRWRVHRRAGFEAQLDHVLHHVRDRGPVMARHFGGDEKKRADGWWDWHPAKTALEYLWRTGALAVARREGFQKVYDLAERVIPAHYRQAAPSTGELIDWACRGALDRLGFATPGELAQFWGTITAAEAAAWCRDNLGRAAIEVAVQSADGSAPKRAYARPDLPDLNADLPRPPGRLRVLSPFDPAIRDRIRTKRLFDFDYRIEVFVPAAKRQYGYYVFPLLERDQLVGRIDMKHDRQAGRLNVVGLWPEPGVSFAGRRHDRLEAELSRLHRLIGADRTVFRNGYRKSGG